MTNNKLPWKKSGYHPSKSINKSGESLKIKRKEYFEYAEVPVEQARALYEGAKMILDADAIHLSSTEWDEALALLSKGIGGSND